MSERSAEQVHPCCAHCADSKEDHVENGGSVPRNGHEVSCSLCDRASAQFRAGVEALLAEAERRQFSAPSHVALREDNGYVSMATLRAVARVLPTAPESRAT